MSTVIVSSNKIDTTHRKSAVIIQVDLYLKSSDSVKHDFEHFLQERVPGPSPRRALGSWPTQNNNFRSVTAFRARMFTLFGFYYKWVYNGEFFQTA